MAKTLTELAYSSGKWKIKNQDINIRPIPLGHPQIVTEWLDYKMKCKNPSAIADAALEGANAFSRGQHEDRLCGGHQRVEYQRDTPIQYYKINL